MFLRGLAPLSAVPPLLLCFSPEMMGHPELFMERDISQLEPLLPKEVVDDLLSKYIQTFTVSPALPRPSLPTRNH